MRNIEFNEQVALFKWAELNCVKYPQLKLLNASLNGVRLNNVLAGKRAKDSGMKKGFPDIFLPVANSKYHGLFIEMKRMGGVTSSGERIAKGKVTKEQEWWLNELNTNGYKAVVCYGFYEAKNVILNYLGYEIGVKKC